MSDSHNPDAIARRVFDIFNFDDSHPIDNLNQSLTLALGTVSTVYRFGATVDFNRITDDAMDPGDIAEALRGAVFHIKAAEYFADLLAEDCHRLREEHREYTALFEALQMELAAEKKARKVIVSEELTQAIGNFTDRLRADRDETGGANT